MAKLVETGGLSRSYFIHLAKSLGYDVTIDEPEPFRCGRNRCGDRLWIPEIVWVWIVNIQDGQVPVYRFRCGSSATGERLMSFGQNMLESIFRDLKPAHTQVVFNYVENNT
ncbi:putative phage tail protein [Candidatus Erwinia dacicola]